MGNNKNKSLLYEISRFKEIMSYGKNITETKYRFYNEAEDAPDNPDIIPDENPQNTTPQPQDNMGDAGMDMSDPINMGGEQMPSLDPPMGDTGASDVPQETPPVPQPEQNPGEQTTEVDITDLINSNKSIEQRMEKTTSTIQRVYDKINDIEGSLSKMDMIIQTMDELGKQVQLMRPPTEDERRRALSDKSYPYNVSNRDYIEGVGHKTQTSLEKRPDKMSMMDTIMNGYDKNNIKKSFYNDQDPMNGFNN